MAPGVISAGFVTIPLFLSLVYSELSPPFFPKIRMTIAEPL